MKLLGHEDMIVGILLGIVMIGASGMFFTFPYNDKLLIGFLFLFLLLAIFDTIYELKTIKESPGWSLFAVVWNIIEIVLVVGYIFEVFQLPFTIIEFIPFISFIGMFGVGIFFILGNVMWLIFYLKD